MITVTPLGTPPLAYVLALDNAKILLDCGLTDSTSPDYLTALRLLAPSLSLVLLTHPTLHSLGALPFLREHGADCTVYATLPTKEMGKYQLEEYINAKSEHSYNPSRHHTVAGAPGNSDEPDSKRRKGKSNQLVLDDDAPTQASTWRFSKKQLRDAFTAITAIRWTQPVHLTGALKGYTLVAHRSGHTLGGTMYTLRPSLSSSLSPASSSSSLLYAPIFNHVKEHHLDGAALLKGARIDESFRRIGVVVVGAERSKYLNVKRVERDKALLDLITTTLQSSRSLLLPTDASARLLELLVLLEIHWTHASLGEKYPLCLVSKTGKDVVGFLRTLTEYMGGQINEEGGEKVLKFSNLQIFSSLAELHAVHSPTTPKLILTTPSSLAYGPSRDLFPSFAATPGNVIILTEKSEEGTLGRWIWERWDARQGSGERWGEGKVGKCLRFNEQIELEIERKIYLSGEELVAHHAAIIEATEYAAKQALILERSRRMMNAEADSSNSDSDTDDEPELIEQEVDLGAGAGAGERIGMGMVRRRVGGFTGGAGAWDEFLTEENGGQTTTTTRRGQTFDIYVKASYAPLPRSSANSLTYPADSTNASTTYPSDRPLARYRTFPVVERKRRVDAYGEAIDVEGWLRRGLEDENLAIGGRDVRIGAGAAVAPVVGEKRSREMEEEEELAKPDEPHKYTVEKVQVHVACKIFVVDMEGKNDGRALKTILPQINPRKLVIINGPPESVQDLSESCRAIQSMTKEIYTPEDGECLVVGEEVKSFSIRLGDSIIGGLKLSRVEDYDVGFISGMIHYDPEMDLAILERTTSILPPLSSLASNPSIAQTQLKASDVAPKGTDVAPMGTDDDEGKEEEGTTILPPLPSAIFIGDLKLTALKTSLERLSIPCQFTGDGTLLCGPAPSSAFTYDFISSSATPLDPRLGAKAVRASEEDEVRRVGGGKVLVRKEKGRLVLEGGVGETMIVVRRVVYGLHAAGG